MKVLSFLKKIRKNQEGSVIVIVALFMTVLMGMSAFVIDLGIVYNAKSKLQNALDSAALAAVRELPISKKNDWADKVEKIAKDYAALNGVDDIENLNIVPLDVYGEPINYVLTNSNVKDINGILISKEAEVGYSFARSFGINNGKIKVDSTTELLTVEGVSGMLPVAISKSAFDYLFNRPDESKTIKFDGNDNKDIGLMGWRGAVNFLDEDNSTADGGKYQDSIIDGFKGVVSINDNISLNPGTMTESKLPNKYVGHENCTYIDGEVKIKNSYGEIIGECNDCPRIATIPIIDFEPTYNEQNKIENVQGKLVKVIGVATIWIENITEKIIVASVISDEYVVNDARVGEVVNDYGVRAAKLTD